MKLRVEQLDSHLEQPLKSVYFLSGDEPLQMMEAADAIVGAAKQQGYDEREVMTVDPQFAWDRLTAATYELSLFSTKQLFDLRLPGCKPGVTGSKVIREYVKRLPDDKILLIRAGKLDASSRNAAWVKDVEKAGVMIQVWDLSPAQTLGWVSKRMRSMGLHPTNDAVRLLTERVEGNLLAAHQEIQKMVLLFRKTDAVKPTPIDEAQVLKVVTDSSRFTVFDLSDAILMGDMRRVEHILRILREEAVAIQLVLWSVTTLSRQLYNVAQATAQGQPVAQAVARMPRPRQGLFKAAMNRLGSSDWNRILQYNAELDRLSKGAGDIAVRDESRLWDRIFDYSLLLSGFRKQKV